MELHYICCQKCQGLLPSGEGYRNHIDVCDGNLGTSSCEFYRCEAQVYKACCQLLAEFLKHQPGGSSSQAANGQEYGDRDQGGNENISASKKVDVLSVMRQGGLTVSDTVSALPILGEFKAPEHQSVKAVHMSLTSAASLKADEADDKGKTDAAATKILKSSERKASQMIICTATESAQNPGRQVRQRKKKEHPDFVPSVMFPRTKIRKHKELDDPQISDSKKHLRNCSPVNNRTAVKQQAVLRGIKKVKSESGIRKNKRSLSKNKNKMQGENVSDEKDDTSNSHVVLKSPVKGTKCAKVKVDNDELKAKVKPNLTEAACLLGQSENGMQKSALNVEIGAAASGGVDEHENDAGFKLTRSTDQHQNISSKSVSPQRTTSSLDGLINPTEQPTSEQEGTSSPSEGLTSASVGLTSAPVGQACENEELSSAPVGLTNVSEELTTAACATLELTSAAPETLASALEGRTSPVTNVKYCESKEVLSSQGGKAGEKRPRDPNVKSCFDFTCPQCPLVFKSRTTFNRHKKTHQGAERGLPAQESKQAVSETGRQRIPDDDVTDSSDKTIDDSPKVATNPEDLRDRYKKYLVTTNHNGKTQTLYKCDQCTKEIKHVGHFDRHMKVHESNHKWQCNYCSKVFYYQSQYRHHMNNHEKPFTCDLCSRSFTSYHALKKHQLIHQDAFPYQCMLCDYKCRRKFSLTTHMRKHTGELYQCDVTGCDFSSCHKASLKKHVSQCHSVTKRYCCHTCGYQTSDTGSFVKHEKYHNNNRDYKCSICDYRAITKYVIVRHMRTHTKEKAYACDECDYTSAQSDVMRKHVMRHRGIKPWGCGHCEYRALTREKIRIHHRVKHTGTPIQLVDRGDRLNVNMKHFRIKNVQSPFTYQVEKVLAEDSSVGSETLNEKQPHTDSSAEHGENRSEVKEVQVIQQVQVDSNLGVTLSLPDSGTAEPLEAYMCTQCGFTSVSLTDIHMHELTNHTGLAKLINAENVTTVITEPS